ncbi:beta strand repeat-containing protein [Flavipsychrobacter stenotrophus]|nr:Ig-like domain-containing protein [Flavipsychrobacter stenotrophus]
MKNLFSLKHVLILLCALIVTTRGNGQTTAAAYNFNAFSGTFSSIAATGTYAGGVIGDDISQTGIPIGFNFTFSGVTYNTVSACSNGWLSLTNYNGTGFVSRNNATTSTATIGAGLLFAYWDDLDGGAFVSPAGTAYYQTTGSSPNRIFTFEWNNFAPFFLTTRATFQIKLYEGSNIIDYCYGAGTYSGMSASIGISNSGTDYQTLPGTGASPAPSSVTFTSTLGGNPTNGQIYRWSGCAVTASATASPAVCPGGTVTLTGVSSGTSYSWTGPGGFTSTLLSPSVPGATAGIYTLSATNGTCTTTATTTVSLLAAPPVPVVTPSVATICNGATVTLTATVPPTPGTVLSQNFNSGIAPWTVDNTGMGATSALSPWQVQANGYLYGFYPAFSTPDGTSFALTNGDAGGSGSTTRTKLVSPVFSLVGYSAATLTFQHFYQYWNTNDIARLEISINGGATWTLINAYTATVGTSTSFQTATFSLAAYLGNANCKIRYDYGSIWGYFWAVDNVLISGTPTAGAAPTWTPTTNLFTNPAGTTAYVAGSPATTVYVHPTTISTTTIVNYIATVTGSGCNSMDTAVVTINPGAAAITGATSICQGLSTTLSNTTAGGTWTTSNTTVASINPTTGVITGLAIGTDTVYYTASGCTAFMVFTVNSGTFPITGPGTVCVTGSITLSNATGGGTWSTGAPATASINTTGVVTGVATGQAIITYSVPGGCTDTALVDVIAPPAAITGSTIVCYGGGVTTLSTTSTGGTWVSGSTGVATVNSATGAVYGVSAGTAAISYLYPSGCYSSANVTVNPPLPSITGPTAVCAGSTISLANTTAGGSWTSGTIAAATVTGSGVVGGVAAGTSTITYSTSVGCNAYKSVNVNPLPAPISGPTGVCAAGATISLTNATGTGSWSSSGPSTIATITSGGVVTGVATGGVTITYTLPVTGCYITTPIAVNPLPAPISGPGAVCEGGSTVTVSDVTAGGSWSATPSGTLSIDAVGTITGGTAGAGTVSYTLSVTGCFVTSAISVNPLPAAIGGTPTVCVNDQVTLINTSGTGTWSSNNTAVATIGTGSGIMGGVSAGSAIITYTLPVTGCYTTAAATVNPLPQPITGITDTVCGGGANISLTSATTGGTWSSGNMSVATIDATTGVVSGVSAGTAPITYSNGTTSCYISRNITVIPTPAVITGTTSVCEAGSVTNLYNSTVPGVWSISSGASATISGTGAVTGIAAGSATVTYTRGNGCFVTTPITVNPLPATITGTFSVCQLSVTTLSSTSPGGGWSVGSPFIASVNSGGGVGGILAGNSLVTYTLPTGCITTATVTVNAIPGTITGANYVCFGGVSTLHNSIAGGVWTTSAPAIASIEATTGIMHGLVVGAATMTYTTGTSGCYATLPITVNGIVSPTVSLFASPSSTVCAGTPVTYSAAITDGGASPLYVWSVNNVILSNATSYSYTPANGDLVRLWVLSSYSCAIPDTASNWITMTVNPIVTPGLTLFITGGDTVCTGVPTMVNAIAVAGGTAPSYQWYVNLAFAGVGPNITYTPANGDVVTAIVTSNAPCSTAPTASATKVITVSDLITPFVSINSSLGLTTCEGYPEVFTTNMTGGGTAPSYQWAVNGVNTVSGNIFTYPPVNGDNVQVTMTSNFPCVLTPTATANETITVLPISQPIGVISAQPGYIIPAGMNDTFTINLISGGGLAPTYQWFIDNIPITGATNSVFITNVLMNGDSVSCAVTNTDQCSGVSVFNSLTIAIGSNVGVHDLTQQGSNLLLIPNPNSGTFTIKGSVGNAKDEEVTLEVTNMLGQVIYRNTAITKGGELDQQVILSNSLAAGMYLLNVQSPNVSKTFHFSLSR